MKSAIKPLLTLCLSAVLLCVAGSVFAQKVAPPLGPDPSVYQWVYAPTADVAIYNNLAAGGTIEQAQLSGEPVPTWFGLWNYSTRHSMLTFDLSSQTLPVAKAQLYLYDYYYEGFMLPGVNVKGTATVRGTSGSFPEPAVGYRIATSDPILTANDTAWPTLGTFTITGSDGTSTTPGDEVGWYAVDVTSLWNANLGGKITLAIRFAASSGMDGPIFEDKEGTAYANGCYGAIADSWPRIVTIPEPTSLVLLALGGLVVWLRRR